MNVVNNGAFNPWNALLHVAKFGKFNVVNALITGKLKLPPLTVVSAAILNVVAEAMFPELDWLAKNTTPSSTIDVASGNVSVICPPIKLILEYENAPVKLFIVTINAPAPPIYDRAGITNPAEEVIPLNVTCMPPCTKVNELAVKDVKLAAVIKNPAVDAALLANIDIVPKFNVSKLA